MKILSRWASKALILIVCGLMVFTNEGSQAIAQPAVVLPSLQCLVKGPSPSVLGNKDPIDIAMEWGVRATINGNSTNAIETFTWVLEQAPKTDSRHAYAWYNLHCVQLSLDPITQLDLEADWPTVASVNHPTPQATRSATDQAQPGFAQNQYQPFIPTEHVHDYSQIFKVDPVFLAANGGLVMIGLHPDQETIRLITQEWRKLSATNSDAANVLYSNVEAVNSLQNLGELAKFACNLGKALLSNCSRLSVQPSEALPYEMDRTMDNTLVEHNDLVDFTMILKLFTSKTDTRDKEVKVEVNGVLMGDILITSKPDQKVEFAVPPLPEYNYVVKAVYVDNQAECGCGTKDRGKTKIQENDIFLITTNAANSENGYQPLKAYEGERLKLILPTR